MSTEQGTLAMALVAFQAEMPSIRKGNTAKVASTKGSYSYDYADLTDITDAAMPILAKHGLSFSSSPMLTENGFVLVYRLRHVSGEEDRGEYPLPDPAHTPAQSIGSAITYARRYTLCAVTGMAPGGDDDDGQKAHDARVASKDSRSKTPTEPVPEPVVDQAAVAAWQEWREAIDACVDRDALRTLLNDGLGRMMTRPIPGDAKSRTVADYVNKVGRSLPERVDASTGEVEPVTPLVEPEVTTWDTVQIPADGPAQEPVEAVEAVIDDDDAPF